MREAETGQEQREILVEPYSPEWPELYRNEASLLAEVFGDLLAAIHHIGSTAVPGLPAKPVIDIIIGVYDFERVDELSPAMESLGYEAWGEYGMEDRRFFPKGGNRRSHHVHVFPAGHPQIARHLRFRDYMRAHPRDVHEYAALKEELAARFPHDIDGYCDGKDEFIAETDRRAAAWAEGIAALETDGRQETG